MITVNQNFQVNTHLLEELLLFSIKVLFKTLQTEFSKSLLLLSIQTLLLNITRWFFLPVKALILVNRYAEVGEKKFYIPMLRVKPSKYLTLSSADCGNTSFHIYVSPAIKNILEINVCVLQFLCVSQLKSSALHCQTVKCAAQQYCINTHNLQSVLTDLVTVKR